MNRPAVASVVISVPQELVWDTLVAPETIARILPVDEVTQSFRLSESFVWTFDLNGQRASVEGRVHALERPRLLAYEYVDPHARDLLGITNVHQVRIELDPDASGTRVSVAEDAHLSDAAHAHAEGGWRLALHNLKALVEAESPRS
jgi:uncharacterized protein YndB with AHSA1/START domain